MYRILAIDNTLSCFKAMNDRLLEQYEVFTAVSGAIAFQYMDREQVDLILLDTAISQPDCWQMIELLGSNPRYSDIPVIVLAPKADQEAEAKSLRLGAYDFITRQVSKEVFTTRIQRVLEIKGRNGTMKEQLSEKAKELERVFLTSVNAMAALIDARDPYTKGHSERVAHYSVLIAENLGWNREEVRRIYEAALLHDVGKIGVPDRILLKASELSKSEMEIMKNHTVFGADILKGIERVKDLELGARYHHERFDGKGYPEGLKGEKIPLIARIICVADSFDAMSSDRCYRLKLPFDKIRKELLAGSGTQFDPKVVSAFLKSWAELSNIEEEMQKKSERFSISDRGI